MAAGLAPSACAFANLHERHGVFGIHGSLGSHGSHGLPSCVYKIFSRPAHFQELRAYEVSPDSASGILRLRVRSTTRGIFRYAAKLGRHWDSSNSKHDGRTITLLTASAAKCALLVAVGWSCVDVQSAFAGPLTSALDYRTSMLVKEHAHLQKGHHFVGGPQNWGLGSAPPVRNSSTKNFRVSAVLDGVGTTAGRKSGSRHVGGLRYSQGKPGKSGALERRVEITSSSSISSLPTASMAGLSLRAFSLSLPAMSVPAIALDAAIVRASAAASLKLFTLCAFVVWLQKSGQLPEATPSVLSQVAFKVLIPCFLMSKVASTLATQPVSSLLGLPLMAVVQVLIGAILGKAGCKATYRPVKKSQNLSYSQSSTSQIPFGNSSQVDVKSKGEEKREAVVTAACAFGNSLTLPLVFISGVLPSAEADRAVSYLALYMVGWSPALWTVGYDIIASGDEENTDICKKSTSLWASIRSFAERVINPPLFGVLLGLLIGATPISHFFLPARESLPFEGMFSGQIEILSKLTAGVFRPALEAASLLGSATLAVQTVVLASSLSSSVPPSFSLSLPKFWRKPENSDLYSIEKKSKSNAAVRSLSIEFEIEGAGTKGLLLEEKCLVGVVESRSLEISKTVVLPQAVEVSNGAEMLKGVEILKGRTVLALGQNEEKIVRLKSVEASEEGLRKESTADPNNTATLLDGKALWIVSLVRLFLLPLVNTALVIALRQANLIPSDPACALTLMVEGAMPSAQNLVLLSQLRASTQPLAGVLAGLMLRQYAISVIPVTLWMAVFLSLLSL